MYENGVYENAAKLNGFFFQEIESCFSVILKCNQIKVGVAILNQEM